MDTSKVDIEVGPWTLCLAVVMFGFVIRAFTEVVIVLEAILAKLHGYPFLP